MTRLCSDEGVANVQADFYSNRERFLTIDPHHFANLLTPWGDAELSSRSHMGWLTDAELSQITAPALVAPRLEPLHPRHTAEASHRLLPATEWIEFADHYPQATLERLAASDALATEKAIVTMPFIKQFLQRIASA